MAQTKQQIQQLIAESGSAGPRHRFGQNFMIDANLVRVIADAGELGRDDLAIEVGPGTGTLTDELLQRAGRVYAVEIDRDLSTMLRARYASEPRFALLEADALAGKHELHPALAAEIDAARSRGQTIRLVANLPYNIASPLIIELLIAGVQSLAFTVQREVAERLRSREGDDAYGPVTAVVALLADVEVLRTLPPQVFWPPPKIESALVRLRRNDQLAADARPFGRFVHTLFAARRKTLRKALDQAGYDPAVLAEAGIDPAARPDTLSPPTLLDLFRRLPGAGQGPTG